VRQFLDCVPTLEHRAILTTCYAAGLGISEALHLRPTDIDSRRMMIWVDQGKGRRELDLLRQQPLLAGTAPAVPPDANSLAIRAEVAPGRLQAVFLSVAHDNQALLHA
jgi:integrase